MWLPEAPCQVLVFLYCYNILYKIVPEGEENVLPYGRHAHEKVVICSSGLYVETVPRRSLLNQQISLAASGYPHNNQLYVKVELYSDFGRYDIFYCTSISR